MVKSKDVCELERIHNLCPIFSEAMRVKFGDSLTPLFAHASISGLFPWLSTLRREASEPICLRFMVGYMYDILLLVVSKAVCVCAVLIFCFMRVRVTETEKIGTVLYPMVP